MNAGPGQQAPNPVIAEDIERIIAAGPDWRRFSGKTVLITGAAGFLPAFLVGTLTGLKQSGAADGVKVIALVRDAARASARLRHLLQEPALRLLVQDVCDPPPSDIRADFVIHAASHASPKFYRADPIGTIGPNVAGTQHMLQLARRSGAEAVLYLSSSEIYGALPAAAVPTPEDAVGAVDPLDPRSCYAESKRMGEALCLAWKCQHGVPVKIARPYHVYGPGMSLDDGRVFADFVADVVADRDITLYSAGTATRSFCYLAEATGAFFRILLDGEAGQAYNVGNPDAEISIRDLAAVLAGLDPDARLKVVTVGRDAGAAYMPSAIERSCPDIGRITALGWKPVIGIEEGFARTIRSYREGDAP